MNSSVTQPKNQTQKAARRPRGDMRKKGQRISASSKGHWCLSREWQPVPKMRYENIHLRWKAITKGQTGPERKRRVGEKRADIGIKEK